MQSQAEAAKELLIRRKARSDILQYANAIEVPGRPMTDDPDTEFFEPIETTMAHHHRLILQKLDEISQTPHGRAMFFMPPGSAKSTYASVVFPSNYLGRNPNKKIILASYGDDLARKLGRRTRSIIKQPRYKGIFDTTLTVESSAAQEFSLMNGSEYMSCGILGGVTGNRAHGIIIDDPIKGREQANSDTIRNKTYDAFEDDLKTRLIPGGWIVLIQCMTGDTKVLLEDGTEKELKNIQVGDYVATYENGKISSSKVLNWKNQGLDCVFTISMSSGITVRANERHPFLVKRNGELQWIQLKNLVVGDTILRVTGENGGALNAPMKNAKSLQNVKDFVCPITVKQNGAKGIDHLQQTQNPEEMLTLNTGMELQQKHIAPYLSHKNGVVQYAENCQQRMLEPIGEGSSALTIATKQEKSGDCSAMTVTLLSDMEKQQKFCLGLLNTYEITLDSIEKISQAGYEDVFDIQVERTENFIANGLVSHNTRWHEDDLAGRILPDGWKGESGKILCKDGNHWEVVCLPAKCENEGDPLGRKIGEYLWIEWFDQKHWAQFESNPRTWAALYQQRPAPLDGDLFKPDQIQIVDALPAGEIKWCRGWDLASTVDGDYTAGGKLGRLSDGRFVIADMVRLRVGPDQRDAAMVNTAALDGRSVKVSIPQDPGQAGKTQVLYLTRALSGYTVKSSPESGDKITRAEPFAAQVNIGNVLMLRGDWNAPLINEMRIFPNGSHDDQVDSLSRAFSEIMIPRKSFFG